jgi:hypothetical protein
MIARIWRGVVHTEDADFYGRYIDETGFSAYKSTPGNQGAWLLWESVDAIKGFAGEDIEAAVYYPEDERYLIEGEDYVRHYSIEKPD